ncbi:MAG: DNA repair protein RecO [Fuerstiella sp.]|nr:DNA repair protein RecO [Fuerstiella sp.]
MSLEKAEALVIRQADFSETSRVITLFSKEFGKSSALAKGAKRLKGPFDAGIDLLSRCRVVFIRKSSGSLDLLTEARLVSRFAPSGTNINSLYGGYYVADLLNGLTEEYDPAPEIYDLATDTLTKLMATDQHSLTSVVEFELGILRLSGLLGSLTECTVCGSPVTQSGQPLSKKFAPWISQGGLLCADCRRPEFSGRSISAGSVAALRQLSSDDSQLSGRLRLTKQQIVECHHFAVSTITSILGRRPSTLRYLDGI